MSVVSYFKLHTQRSSPASFAHGLFSSPDGRQHKGEAAEAPNPAMTAFFSAKLPANVVAGSEVAVTKSDDHKWSKALESLTSHNANHRYLQNVVLEFVWHVAAGIGNDVLGQVTNGGIASAVRHTSDRAARPLGRIADGAGGDRTSLRDPVWLMPVLHKAVIML
jgi:hypothetical protein